MNASELVRKSDTEWWIEPTGSMRVPGILYATEPLIREMDDKVSEQVRNVASLPGIVGGSYAMPDAHWGYGFLIGGVAAFDPDADGVVSAGGVGFDISCGVRTLVTRLREETIEPVKSQLAEELFHRVPAGMGQRGRLHLNDDELDAMLTDGARWAVARGLGAAGRSGANRGRWSGGRGESRRSLAESSRSPARRDGHAGIREPLPGGPTRGGGSGGRRR
jgi:tRNA-splicing ligase RtcB